MILIFVHIIAPVISGCAIAFFTHWLSKCNKKLIEILVIFTQLFYLKMWYYINILYFS
ncbi:hypothetical protein A284_12067 (plasmid) [Staphylococcus warneri SG1]|nr:MULTISPECIES: type I toxin-antitoxin system Fst family toxin [Staphylococcus]AGC91691.1 hypothetical protein A284_12067 [Staphylococcus warneri SG1]MDK8581616.1 type I toxin-antitoxin system Fst family toxin [Staphylococcus aureus]MEC0623429.1 type I toxin-antitoxin system Fst family toxin [Staphylococcus warneri]